MDTPYTLRYDPYLSIHLVGFSPIYPALPGTDWKNGGPMVVPQPQPQLLPEGVLLAKLSPAHQITEPSLEVYFPEDETEV